MYFLSCLIFIAFMIWGFWLGSSLELFSDLGFPTVLALVLLPSLVFTIASTSLQSFKLTVKILCEGEGEGEGEEKEKIKEKRNSKQLNKAKIVLKSLGNTSFTIGFLVAMLNAMSLGFNLNDKVSISHLSIGISQVLMSIFIGLVIKVICSVGTYKLEFNE